MQNLELETNVLVKVRVMDGSVGHQYHVLVPPIRMLSALVVLRVILEVLHLLLVIYQDVMNNISVKVLLV
jgi:hypothetical protein